MEVTGQKLRILNHLMSGKDLTRLDSWELLGVLEAPARICELRSDGYQIHTHMFEVKNHYGEKCRVARWYMDEPFGE